MDQSVVGFCFVYGYMHFVLMMNSLVNDTAGMWGVKAPRQGMGNIPGNFINFEDAFTKIQIYYNIHGLLYIQPPFPWTASLPMDRIPSPFCEMIRIHPSLLLDTLPFPRF